MRRSVFQTASFLATSTALLACSSDGLHGVTEGPTPLSVNQGTDGNGGQDPGGGREGAATRQPCTSPSDCDGLACLTISTHDATTGLPVVAHACPRLCGAPENAPPPLSNVPVRACGDGEVCINEGLGFSLCETSCVRSSDCARGFSCSNTFGPASSKPGVCVQGILVGTPTSGFSPPILDRIDAGG